MYNTKAATINNEEFTSSYMPVGINENVFLKDVTVEKTQNGRDFLRITFENEDGQTAEMTEWKNEPSTWIKTKDDLQRRDNIQFGRILQLINCFFATTPEVELNSFAEMINWVKNTLSPLIATKKKLRIKCIYDKNGYVRVSQNGIYVEPMDVEETQIKLFKRDTLERPIKADVETSADPLTSTTADSTPDTANSTTGLPF